MANWTTHDITRLKQRNPDIQIVGAWENASPERTVRKNPLGENPSEVKDTGRFLVRIVSVRKRLADPDGLVPKWHLDALRYAGVIPDDTAEVLELSVSQRKCAKGEEERTEIEVYQIT